MKNADAGNPYETARVCIRPGFAEFEALAQQGNLIPVYTEVVADTETPVSAFRKLSAGKYAFLLESAEKLNHLGRYSFLGADPPITIESIEDRVKITENGECREFLSDDPLGEVRRLMEPYQPAGKIGEAPFAGGAVGFCGYDLVRTFEPTVGPAREDTLGLPDMVFMIARTFLSFDHRYRKLRIVSLAKIDEAVSARSAYLDAIQRIEEVFERLRQPTDLSPISITAPKTISAPLSNTAPEEYMAMVEQAKEYIRAGDIFQVVLSQRFHADFEEDPIELYRHLRYINPSPFMFLLQFPDRFSLVGSSPELHVRSMDGKVTIRPIAGTRKRGATPEEDAALRAELLADPKERAEHIMLVDLARNDVGRIAEYNSVQVDELMIVEEYSHVMHIVSNVLGDLRGDRDAYDVLRATFPAGTVSGSPKVRAMQIINELEKHKRCAYAGAVGYFGFDGNHDSCIALRTVVVKDKVAYVQAGAGLVADSVPEMEQAECENKARAMLTAIEAGLEAGSRLRDEQAHA